MLQERMSLQTPRFKRCVFLLFGSQILLPPQYRTDFPPPVAYRSLRVPGKSGWRHWLIKASAQFLHSAGPLQPDLLERQARRGMQRTLQKAFSQHLQNTAYYRSVLTLALHRRSAPVEEQAEIFDPTSRRAPQVESNAFNTMRPSGR